MPHDPEELVILAAKMQKPQERYLKWKQICDRYDRGYKTEIARAFLVSSANSIEERKNLSYANPNVIAYLESWDKAEKEKIKAQVEYDNLKTQFDALQSALSYQREELKRGM